MNRKFNHVLVQAALGALGVAFLAGCPAPVVTPPPEIAAAPRILSFTASPTLITTEQEVRLQWETENATEIEILDPARGTLSGVDNQASGTLPVQVDGNTLFVIKARNARGVTDTAAVAVEIESGVETVQFFVSEAEIDPGESAVIAWSAPGARAVTLTANGQSLDLLGQRSSGSLVVAPDSTVAYVFTADDVTREATLVVRPKLHAFTATPEAVEPGGTVTLSWRTTGATRVVIESGHGPAVTIDEPGRVREGSHSDPIPDPVSPNAVFSYKLRVTTPDGEVTQSRKVYVAGTPRVIAFDVPEYSRLDEDITLSWTTLEAARVEIRRDGVLEYLSPDAPTAASGSIVIPSPTATTKFTLTAFGLRGGEDSASAFTEPVGAPSATFSAAPMMLVNGGEPVELSWTLTYGKKLRVRAEDGLHALVIDGDVTQTGTTVYPNETTRYVLEIDNGVGETFEADLTVQVTNSSVITTTSEPPFISGSTMQLHYPGADNGELIYGYPHTDVAYRTASPNWIEIGTTGTPVEFTSTDNSTRNFTPENFETFLWGERYEGPFSVCTNGWLAPGAITTITSVEPASLPNIGTAFPERVMAPFWDDLNIEADSKVTWQVVGQAPDRILVVQWTNAHLENHETTSSLNFQVQLFQTGVVRFVYRTMNMGGAAATYSSYRVGTQNKAKNEGRQYASPSGGIPSGSEIAFFGPKMAPIPGEAKPGGPHAGFVRKATGTHEGYARLTFTVPAIIPTNVVRFTEFMYRPSVPGAEYVELANFHTEPIDLHGFTISNDIETHLIDRANGNTIIPAHGALVMGVTRDPALNDGLGTRIDYAYGSEFSLPDTGSTKLTLAKDGKMSERSYSDGQGGLGISYVYDDSGFQVRIQGNTTTNYNLLCGARSNTVFGTQTPQQRGTPGYVSSCFGYTKTPIPVRFYDIVGKGGVPLFPGSVDVYVPVTLGGGSRFPFFGQEFSTVSASFHGHLAITNDALPAQAAYFPTHYPDTATSSASSFTPNGNLAIFGDDMERVPTQPDSNVFYKHVAAGEDPGTPDEHWVFQWNHVRQYLYNSGDDLTFQIKLFKDGAVEYHYGAMDSNSPSGYYSSEVVWIENLAGTHALWHSVSSDTVVSNMALRYDVR